MRLLLLITFFITQLFAIIDTPLRTTISSVNEEKATIKTLKDAQVGMYGMIIRWFDDTHSTALSWVEVEKIEGETTTLNLTPILALEQSALPSGTWKPAAGDEVLIGYNYQRGLLIAPNSSVYKKITRYHANRKWIHPDIFAAVLSSRGHPSPLKEDFAHACRANNIGVVSIMFDKTNVTLDCQSFKVLSIKSTSIKAKEPLIPFYTRVTNIEANWFGEGSNEVEEYNSYYLDLIAEHNPKNSWIQAYKHKREQATGKDDSWFGSMFGNFKVTADGDEDYE